MSRNQWATVAFLVTYMALLVAAAVFVIAPAVSPQAAPFVGMCLGLLTGWPVGRVAYFMWSDPR